MNIIQFSNNNNLVFPRKYHQNTLDYSLYNLKNLLELQSMLPTRFAFGDQEQRKNVKLLTLHAGICLTT